jgi:CelD/BcsL family acetyltransferase involved in cellulose biosynthesis
MNMKDQNVQRSTMLIDPLDQSWLDFAESHPESTIFHHPAWIKLLADSYGYRPFVLVVLDEKNVIRAGVPFMEIRRVITGRRFVSLPYSDCCQPLSKDDVSLRILTSWFTSAYQNKKIPRIELRWDYPENEHIIKDVNYVKHIIRLCDDSELVTRNFKRTHQQNIRTARKRGVRIEWGDQPEHLKIYYNLQLETRHRHGVPCQPCSFFNRLAKSIFQQGLGFVLLAYHKDECIAGVVFLHWKKHLIAKYAASKATAINLRPNNLLFWKGIEWGCNHGYYVLDFGRSKKANHGLCRFKRGWGAEERPLIYSTLSKRPIQTGEHFSHKIMHSLIRKTPSWVCRFTGEILYRHFG